MQFLFVSGIYPPEIGGPARVMFDTAEGLRAESHTVTVITYGEGTDSRSQIMRVSRSGSSLMRYLRLAKAIRMQLTSETVLVATDVFSVGIPARLALIGKKNCFLLRLGGEWAWEDAITKGRFVGTLRNFWKQRFGIRAWTEKKKYQWITKRAQIVFVTSSFLGDILSQYIDIPKSKIQLAENQASFGAQKRVMDPSKPLRFLYIGRFAPVKNVAFLAKILRDCEVQGFSFQATLIGDGPDFSEIKQILTGSRSITLLPPVDRAGVAQAFAEHDVFVLPSLSDICPNAVLEALANGLPCLITSEHGLHKPLAGTVELDPEDEQAWKDMLKKWIENPAEIRSLAAQIQSQKTPSSPSLAERLISFAQAE